MISEEIDSSRGGGGGWRMVFTRPGIVIIWTINIPAIRFISNYDT